MLALKSVSQSPELSPLVLYSCCNKLRTKYPVQTIMMELHSRGRSEVSAVSQE